MAIDIGSFVVKLARKIEATTDPQELLILTKAISKLKTGSISSVSSYSLLPTVTASIYGEIYLVENEPAFYFAHPTLGWQNFGNIPQFSRLYSWGSNCQGQLGSGGNDWACRSSPGFVLPTGLTSWRMIAINEGQVVTGASGSIRADGTLWTWGNGNTTGAGNTTSYRNSPATTAGGGTNWAALQFGGGIAIANKTDGTLWTWGFNYSGQLGDNSVTHRSSPGTVIGNSTDWCVIQFNNKTISTTQAGSSAAIKNNGTLWTWGKNYCGILGDGTTTYRSSPGTVAGGGTTWCEISGFSAIKIDGTLWTWGRNHVGQLGDNSVTNRSSPGTVAGGGTTWCTISSGGQTTGAIKTDGTLWMWGRNIEGQIGDSTTICRSSPATVAGGGTTWCLVSSRSFTNAAAIKTDGTLWTWGYNIKGQLGNSSQTNRSSPGTVSGGGTNWSQVAIGAHTLALDCYSG